MKLYVYCLAEKLADTIADKSAPVSGVSGAKVDVITIDEFSVLASEYEGDTVPVSRGNALAHAAVVRSVLNETTPLPFRFGTLVSKEQLRSYATARREALQAKLAQVRGCVEMSVKIIWDAEDRDLDVESAEQGPGARFLKEKQREILGGEHRAERARQVASWLQEQVGSFVSAEEVSLCPTEKLIVAAAHLVPREQVATYRQQLFEAREIRQELHFMVSGPWPPYSFSNIELEFKTRFGVS